MLKKTLPLLGVLPSLLLLLFVGCETGPEYPDTYPVEVTVLKEDKPVEGAMVTFHDLDGTHSGSGVTDAEGKTQITTFENNDGCVEGTFKVTVNKSEEKLMGVEDPDNPEAVPTGAKTIYHVPKQYSSVSSTPFEKTITPEGENSFTLEVD